MGKPLGPRRLPAAANGGAGPEQVDREIAFLLERLRTRLTAVKGWTQLAERQATSGQSPVLLLSYLQRSLRAMVAMQSTIDRVARGSRRTTSPASSHDRR